MKAYFSILLLFCAISLGYGSSHVISDSVVKNRVDIIESVTTKTYRFRKEILSKSKLDSLLKSTHDEQIDEYVSQSNSKNKMGNFLFWIFGLTLVAAVILTLALFEAIFYWIFKNKSTNFTPTIVFMYLSDIAFITSGIFGIVSKKKARLLKRKALERYNEIVKSQK